MVHYVGTLVSGLPELNRPLRKLGGENGTGAQAVAGWVILPVKFEVN